MRSYDFGQFGNSALVDQGRLTAKSERGETAKLLAIIAEIDKRGIYVPLGYSSLFAFCVKEFKLSEDAANRRIQAARAARRFPFLFEAVDDARLNLTAIRLLAPHLTLENAQALAAAASGQSITQVQRLIAQRFPLEQAPKATQTVRAIPSRTVGVPASRQVDPLFQGLNSSTQSPHGAVSGSEPGANGGGFGQRPESGARAEVSPAGPATTPIPTQAPAPIPTPVPAPSIAHRMAAPLAPERYLVRFTVARSTHDKLRYAQLLSSHSNPGGSIERIVDEALDLFIEQKEKQRFARTDRPRRRSEQNAKAGPPRGLPLNPPEARASSAPSPTPSPTPSPAPSPTPSPAPSPTPSPTAHRRFVPAEVKRAVWKRDGGQCTYVSSEGRRCESRKFLEFDHIDPVARGGKATVERMRLRCRAHNQYEAEKTFGRDLMRKKREEAQRAPKPPVVPHPGEQQVSEGRSPYGGEVRTLHHASGTIARPERKVDPGARLPAGGPDVRASSPWKGTGPRGGRRRARAGASPVAAAERAGGRRSPRRAPRARQCRPS